MINNIKMATFSDYIIMCMSNYYVYLLSSKLKKKCTNLSKTVINLTSTSFPEIKLVSFSGVLKMSNVVPRISSSFIIKLPRPSLLAIVMTSLYSIHILSSGQLKYNKYIGKRNIWTPKSSWLM